MQLAKKPKPRIRLEPEVTMPTEKAFKAALAEFTGKKNISKKQKTNQKSVEKLKRQEKRTTPLQRFVAKKIPRVRKRSKKKQRRMFMVKGMKTAIFGRNRKLKIYRKYNQKRIKLHHFTSRAIKFLLGKKKSQTSLLRLYALKKALKARIINKKPKLTYAKTLRIMKVLNTNELELRFNFWNIIETLIARKETKLDEVLIDKNIYIELLYNEDARLSSFYKKIRYLYNLQIKQQKFVFNYVTKLKNKEKNKLKSKKKYSKRYLKVRKLKIYKKYAKITQSLKVRFKKRMLLINKAVQKIIIKKRNLLLKMEQAQHKDRETRLLSNLILLGFILTAKLEMGERIHPKTKNDMIKSHFMGIRNEHAIYNINLLFLGLRLTLGLLWNRMKHKKRTLINYANPKRHNQTPVGFRPVQEFAKNFFVITWKKWIGGILTNFKRLSKRIISRMQNDGRQALLYKTKNLEKTSDYFISFTRDLPRLPAFNIFTTNSHWALNESKRMRIPATQLIEISHLGYFGDINIAMNTHYLGLRCFTELLKESMVEILQRAKALHGYKLDLFLTAKTLVNSSNVGQAKNIISKFAKFVSLSAVKHLVKRPKRPSKPQIYKRLSPPLAHFVAPKKFRSSADHARTQRSKTTNLNVNGKLSQQPQSKNKKANAIKKQTPKKFKSNKFFSRKKKINLPVLLSLFYILTVCFDWSSWSEWGNAVVGWAIIVGVPYVGWKTYRYFFPAEIDYIEAFTAAWQRRSEIRLDLYNIYRRDRQKYINLLTKSRYCRRLKMRYKEIFYLLEHTHDRYLQDYCHWKTSKGEDRAGTFDDYFYTEILPKYNEGTVFGDMAYFIRDRVYDLSLLFHMIVVDPLVLCYYYIVSSPIFYAGVFPLMVASTVVIIIWLTHFGLHYIIWWLDVKIHQFLWKIGFMKTKPDLKVGRPTLWYPKGFYEGLVKKKTARPVKPKRY